MSKQTAICRSVFMLTLLFLLSLTSFSQTSFKVSGKVFDENGVPHGEIRDLSGNGVPIYVLAFRDPDNIQLEFTAPK